MAEVANPVAVTEGTTDQPASPTIGLGDLQNAIKVIDFACEQGAFKGWATIEQVAAVRAKLAAFVDAATPKEEAPVVAAKTKTKAKAKVEAKPSVKKVTATKTGSTRK